MRRFEKISEGLRRFQKVPKSYKKRPTRDLREDAKGVKKVYCEDLTRCQKVRSESSLRESSDSKQKPQEYSSKLEPQRYSSKREPQEYSL